MLTAKAANGEIVDAWETDRAAGPFSCPGCGQPVNLKKGSWKIEHFAHHPGSICCDRKGESERHARLKRQIYEDAKANPYVREARMEYAIGTTVADLIVKGARRKVAIEVQLSPISEEEILRRMAEHKAHGFSTLWVVDPGSVEELLKEAQMATKAQFKVKAFQKDIHWLADGALFVYAGHLRFHAFHLMGYRWQTYKHFKLAVKEPVHLFSLEDQPFRYETGVEYTVATIAKDARWWLKYED